MAVSGFQGLDQMNSFFRGMDAMQKNLAKHQEEKKKQAEDKKPVEEEKKQAETEKKPAETETIKTESAGKQVANTNAGVAGANVGDYIIRSNGQRYILKQGDIDWAKQHVKKTSVPKKAEAPKAEEAPKKVEIPKSAAGMPTNLTGKAPTIDLTVMKNDKAVKQGIASAPMGSTVILPGNRRYVVTENFKRNYGVI